MEGVLFPLTSTSLSFVMEVIEGRLLVELKLALLVAPPSLEEGGFTKLMMDGARCWKSGDTGSLSPDEVGATKFLRSMSGYNMQMLLSSWWVSLRLATSLRLQVTPSSGISSRGYDISQSTPGSAGALQIGNDQHSGLDFNEDVTSSILIQGPPGTGNTRNGIDIYSSLSATNKLSGVIGSSSLSQPSVSSFFDKFSQSSQSNSLTITARVNKMIKIQRKLIRQQQDLAKEIASWCNVLPNEESKSLMESFIRLLEHQVDVTEGFITREQAINVQLGNVNKRERRSNDLKLKRNKMLVRLRDAENKLGDNPATTLIRENLDELDGSVDIVEDQFVNSINNGLRQSIVEYSVILQESGTTSRELSRDFIDRFHLGPNLSNKENIGSGNKNLQRLILQNKLMNSLQNREIKSSSGNSFMGNSVQPKYVAISQNQVGKIFDNKFEIHSGRSSPVKKASNLSMLSRGLQNTVTENDEEDIIEDDSSLIKPLNTSNKANPSVINLKDELKSVSQPQIQPQLTQARMDELNYKQELLKLQQDYKNLRILYQQKQTEMHEAQLEHELQLQLHEQQTANQNQQIHLQQIQPNTTTHDSSSFGNIINTINSFNTPGSLAIRPSSQVSNPNHEWNT
ncbi:hypothetical protein WICPIJ_003613 [Wickerhamomyces pijperi]|uniref:Uncharacterized protein n=1 Tax=Wickerhamomyces pijperi TaxID=599730 RepID=A0A9P8Q9L7_WICPI|nr:hypothetical protein WICPIJ_003613 [Wickerhamomyces pijperi]